MDDVQRVTFVKVKLKAPTKIWWHNIDDNNVIMGRPTIPRWADMREVEK